MSNWNRISGALEFFYDRVGKNHHSVDGILPRATRCQVEEPVEESIASFETTSSRNSCAPLIRIGVLLSDWTQKKATFRKQQIASNAVSQAACDRHDAAMRDVVEPRQIRPQGKRSAA